MDKHMFKVYRKSNWKIFMDIILLSLLLILNKYLSAD